MAPLKREPALPETHKEADSHRHGLEQVELEVKMAAVSGMDLTGWSFEKVEAEEDRHGPGKVDAA